MAEIPIDIPGKIVEAFRRGTDLSMSRFPEDNENGDTLEAAFVTDIIEGFKSYIGDNVICDTEAPFKLGSFQARKKSKWECDPPNHLDIRFRLVPEISNISSIAVEAKCDFINDNFNFKDLVRCDAALRLPACSDDLKIIAYLADYKLLNKYSTSRGWKRRPEAKIVLKYLKSGRDIRIMDFVNEMSVYQGRDQYDIARYAAVLEQNTNLCLRPILVKVSDRILFAIYQLYTTGE